MRPPVVQIVFSLHLKILTTESLLSRDYYRLSSAISLMSPISPSFALDLPGVQSVAVKSCVPLSSKPSQHNTLMYHQTGVVKVFCVIYSTQCFHPQLVHHRGINHRSLFPLLETSF